MADAIPRTHLNIGSLIYPRMDQGDFTGPFEVFSRLSDTSVHVIWKDKMPLRDVRGLILQADTTFAETPPLDVLHIPGGAGQETIMEDETVLAFIRERARQVKYVFGVCTGVLLCGAAGLLMGKRATTHWLCVDLLEYFGATPVRERVVIDGNLVTTAGVTAGIDGALKLVSLLRGETAAQQIQLYMEYAPQPPFAAGSPTTAPANILQGVWAAGKLLQEARTLSAQKFAKKLGVRQTAAVAQ